MTSVHFMDTGNYLQDQPREGVDEQLTDELVKDIDMFSSLVCLLRDCYDVSPVYGHWMLPAASTE